MANGWGGAREGAGRRKPAADGTERKMKTMRASLGEWELIKRFGKLAKDDYARAERVLQEQGY